jgi:hypothetical protein
MPPVSGGGEPIAVPGPRPQPGAPAGPPPSQVVHKIGSVDSEPIRERLTKERTRTILIWTFAATFFFILAGSLAGAFLKSGPVGNWLQNVLPAETALFGSAIGFYFGRNAD